MKLSDAIDYVILEAGEEDLGMLLEAIHARRKHLQLRDALQLKVGMEVSIAGISPKYLNGMKGTLASVKGARGDVTLDQQSTQILRFRGGERYFIGQGVENYLLRGVPLSTCKPVEREREL